MKTNTIHVIITSVFLAVIALMAGSKSAIDINQLAAGISYLAVAILGAVAAVDYRKNVRDYVAR